MNGSGSNLLFGVVFIVTLFVFGFQISLFIGLIILVVLYLKNRKNVEVDMVKSATKSDENILNFDYLQNQPFAYAVLDNFDIVGSDKEFKKIGGYDATNITEIVKNFSLSEKRQQVSINGKYYELYSSSIFKSENGMTREYTAVFFIPNDHINGKAYSCEEERTIVSLIFIDDYDEVLDSTEEFNRPILQALIDRQLNDLSNKVSGIIRKFEKDKYMFIFSNEKLDLLKEEKFEILSKIRDIQVGNTLPVTLSIGIGLNGSTLSQSMEYALRAMDLALGRGGDQVLIKDSENYYFYGGTSKENITNKRVRSRVKAYALLELIDDASNIMVMGHRNADLDCFGAGVGVYKIANSRGKKCNIILNKIMPSVGLLYDSLLEAKPIYEKVFVNHTDSDKLIKENTLLIVVDTHKVSMTDNIQIFEKVSKIVILDHHRKGTDFIDNAILSYHEPFASSTCELVTEMIQSMDNVKLDDVEADALLAGITMDTKNFAFKTGAKTFETAAFLRRNGADSVRVRMLFQNDFETCKAKSNTVGSAKIFRDSIVISVCTSNVSDLALVIAMSADDLLNVFGIKASFVLCSQDDLVLISGRSLGGINVQMIMEKLGGGGHQMVSGAQLIGITLDEAMEKLKVAIDEYMEVNV